jgi:two-component system, sensor histidine kinase SagS
MIPEARKSALIIEDNRISSLVFCSFMQEMNWYAYATPNGREALDELIMNKYDLVLTDLHMSVMDGFETTQYIKRLYADTVIVVVTASNLLEEHHRALAQGAAEVLMKPVSFDALKKCVEKYFPTDGKCGVYS